MHVNDYWFYLEYQEEGNKRSVLMEVPKDSSGQVIGKAKSLFGDRVSVTNFPEKGLPLKTEDLKDVKAKQVVKIDKENHPLPDLKPGEATVLVVCPPLAARNAGKGVQFKLHANDKVVAVNKMGTYSLAYLDPGMYKLVSQGGNANGFDMQLEAGHKYFFLQNTFQGGLKPDTVLSRNSPELVMYLLDGSYYSDWKPKQK